ncbi:MAG: deoxyribose-phosphate aldolase [Acidimicrobiales bacterium]
MTALTVHRLVAVIDHTLLDPLAISAAVVALCAEARDWSFGHVCVSPSRVELAVAELAGTAVGVCSVVGFPSGAHTSASKAFEASAAVDHGAGEIDMVVNLGLVADGDWSALQHEVRTVVAAAGAGGASVKAILETAAFNGPTAELAARAALDGGAAWVKTSTGYHPAGGASLEAVAVLARVAAGRGGVKASGGIRTLAQARTFLDAGAGRLGTSRGVALVQELQAEPHVTK